MTSNDSLHKMAARGDVEIHDSPMNLHSNPLLSLLAAFALLLSMPSHAAGFDCAKAASVTEKAICSDSKLSKLDGDLAVAWNTALDLAIDSAPMKSSQLQWLKRRNSCGGNTACLTASYDERLAALVRAQFTVQTDQAGNRLEALIEQSPGKPSDADAKRCTADKRLCVQVVHDDADSAPFIQVDSAGQNPAAYRLAISDTPDASGDVSIAPWPHVVRLADDNGAILVGAEINVSTSYSGGGGYASELRLFEIVTDGSAFHDHEVLSVPLAGSLMISACFTEQDQRRRLGACHDEYQFGATLGLDPAVRSRFPRLIYQTRATSFPGRVSRNKDSLEGPPLRERDLVTAVDHLCTYKRVFEFDAGQRVYVPDHSLPDCSDYTVP